MPRRKSPARRVNPWGQWSATENLFQSCRGRRLPAPEGNPAHGQEAHGHRRLPARFPHDGRTAHGLKRAAPFLPFVPVHFSPQRMSYCGKPSGANNITFKLFVPLTDSATDGGPLVARRRETPTAFPRLRLRRRRKGIVRSAKKYSPQSTRVLCGKYSCASRRVLRRLRTPFVCHPRMRGRICGCPSARSREKEPPKTEPAKSDGRQDGRRKRQDKMQQWQACPWHARHRRCKRARPDGRAPPLSNVNPGHQPK